MKCYHTLLKTIFLSLLLLLSMSNITLAAGQLDKKAVILIMDYCDVADLEQANTPNLDRLMTKSGTALINIRTKSRLPGSSYMSLAVGSRVGMISNSEYSFNNSEIVKEIPNVFADEDSKLKAGDLYRLFTGKSAAPGGVINLYSEPLKKYASKHYPVFEIGQLGKLARESNLAIAVLGNSDTSTLIDRNIVLLAMDENGRVPQGNVSQDVLESAPQSLGGVRSNHQALMADMNSLLPSTDILIMDMGDTSRVEKSRENCSEELLLMHRRKAIEQNDRLLGKIMAAIDMHQTLLLLLTPNPNKDMTLQGNFALTPIIMYNPEDGPGLLTSSTTRRTGVVNSSDFLPTVINYFDETIFPAGSGMNIIKTDRNQLNLLEEQATFYLNQRLSRNPVHYLYMLLGLLAILASIMLYTGKYARLKNYYYITIYAALSVPIIFLFLYLGNYNSLPLTLLITLAASLLSGSIIHAVFRQPDNALIFLCGITTILLTIDCFRGSPLMLFSLLGSDTIAGGRFYGLGNDFSGVYLAAALVSTCLLLARSQMRPAAKALAGLIPLSIVSIAIGSPSYGADVGGLVTTLVTTGVFLLFYLEKKLHLKQLLLIGGVAVLLVILVATMDSLFSSNPSHAGKTMILLFNGGFAAFWAIIRTKVGIVGSTIYHSSWSIVLLLCIMVMLFFWFKDQLRILQMAEEQPELNKLAKLLLIMITTLFAVNDTGVIAAALATLYLLSCVGMLRIPVGNPHLAKGKQ
ncbi:MAG: hypothetical protein PHX14_02640 [Syntrophomonadaceae bacterium]|nr:hypothetical protein [Syntrophomonadaceae bacterium]